MPKIGVGKEADPIKPYWTTTDGQHVKLYLGNVTDVLARLPAKSVHMCVTSPPYWGLRDYKAGDDEIGREKTPGEFVDRMVEVFRGVRRVLRDDGTVWLNLGSSYWSGSAVVKDDNRTLTLRDDLTPDEIQYVLSEMAASMREGNKVSIPN